MGTGTSPGVKRPGFEDHPPASSAGDKETIELYLHTPSGAWWPVLERPLPYSSVSQTFFKWGPLSLVRMFYGPPYSWDYETH